jgi:hypothetical protein
MKARHAVTKILVTLGVLLGIVPVARAADTLIPGQFHFSYFSVPGAVTLQVNDISDLSIIVGNYVNSAGNTAAFVRSPNGTSTTKGRSPATVSPAYQPVPIRESRRLMTSGVSPASMKPRRLMTQSAF